MRAIICCHFLSCGFPDDRSTNQLFTRHAYRWCVYHYLSANVRYLPSASLLLWQMWKVLFQQATSVWMMRIALCWLHAGRLIEIAMVLIIGQLFIAVLVTTNRKLVWCKSKQATPIPPTRRKGNTFGQCRRKEPRGPRWAPNAIKYVMWPENQRFENGRTKKMFKKIKPYKNMKTFKNIKTCKKIKPFIFICSTVHAPSYPAIHHLSINK